MEQGSSKSILHLTELKERTEGNVFRYFDLIRECGFDLQRDDHNRYFIVDERSSGVRFSQEKAKLLKELVLTHANQNKLKDSLLTKIYLGSEIQMVASHLVNAKNGKVPHNEMGFEIYPDGLCRILRQFAQNKSIKNIVIKENGVCVNDDLVNE